MYKILYSPNRFAGSGLGDYPTARALRSRSILPFELEPIPDVRLHLDPVRRLVDRPVLLGHRVVLLLFLHDERLGRLERDRVLARPEPGRAADLLHGERSVERRPSARRAPRAPVG